MRFFQKPSYEEESHTKIKYFIGGLREYFSLKCFKHRFFPKLSLILITDNILKIF